MSGEIGCPERAINQDLDFTYVDRRDPGLLPVQFIGMLLEVDMSDYDDFRNRQYRNIEDDFDYEGGYGGGNFDYNRGNQWRNRDYYRGAYGRGSDFDRGQFDQNRYARGYGNYGQDYGYGGNYQARSPYNRNQFGQDWNTGRAGFNRSWQPSRDYYDRDFDLDQGSYGRGMDYDRGDYDPYYGRSMGYRGQPGWGMSQDWDYNRGSFGRGSQGRQGFGYNRGLYQQDWGGDHDSGIEYDFGPADYTFTQSWLISGPETGRGPRGYQRSDARIFEDVCDRLMQHGRIDASDITVTVQNCVVTLSGSVDSRGVKRMAEDVAENVPGV
ncbi:MAG TPA: BON domain-containing protein, partial [Candidatus Methylomirabilis sp.]|nr:BON domain-containing protein [Candidatus Methylomirabilis sp.]